jgi:DNA-binding NtrC family response regulator
LIVASNRPLEREVASGRFRADLFYRFNVVAFEIPPLRERIPLIPALARSMLAEFAARNGRRIDAIAPEAMQPLLAHSWPGNIRELRNVIERAVALCPGDVIALDDLPEHLHKTGPSMVLAPAAPALHLLSTVAESCAATVADRPAAAAPPLPAPATIRFAATAAGPRSDRGSRPKLWPSLAESKDRAELSMITQALERNGQNRLRAAADLGISRMTLYKKLHKYGLMRA